MAKYQKQFNISLPTSLFNQFHASIGTMPPNFDYEIEGFYGIIRDITTGLNNHTNRMVPLSSVILQHKYGKHYRKMLDYLCHNNIITENHQYTEGSCRTYGIKSLLSISSINDITIIHIDLQSMFGKYVKKRHNAEQKLAKGKQSHIRELRNRFYKLKLDVSGALAELENNKNSITDEQFIAIYDDILSFDNKNLMYFKRNDCNNRIDTNLTSLKSYFKKFIESDIPLYQLDLKNSQPVLFNIILDIIYKLINDDIVNEDIYLTLCYKNKYIKDTISLIYQWIKGDSKWVDILKKEIPLYKEYTSNGTWYNHISDIYNKHYNTGIFTRDMSKSLWMALAYSGNYSEKYNTSKLAFEKEYKGIGRLLRKFKQKEYNQLAICLQKIESEIFIDDIAKKLIEKGIKPLTIHDSIIIEESQIEATTLVMYDSFEQHLGFAPILEKEALIDLEFKVKHDAEDIAKIIDDLEVSCKKKEEIESINDLSPKVLKNNTLDIVRKGDTINIRSFMIDIYSRLNRAIDTETIINFEMFVNHNSSSVDEVFKAMLVVFKENRYPVSDYKHILIDEEMIRVVHKSVAA